MHISEILKAQKIDPVEEFNRIEFLLNENSIPYGLYDLISLKLWINKNTFRNLNIRDRYTDIDDMLKNIGIYNSISQFNYDTECLEDPNKCFEKLYLYCEVLLNIISESSRDLFNCADANKVANHISKNISKILEKTHCKISKVEDGIIIVDNNYVATEAVECIDNDVSLACAIMEYNRILNKGNVERKKQILLQLATYTEPWYNDFKETAYDKLYDDYRFLANEIDIRHNNKQSSKNIFTDGWTPKDYENWYDKTYHTILMVIIARRQLMITEEIQELKIKKIPNPNLK